MAETPEEAEVALPRSLVALKWLVIVLTLSLIGGVITVVWLLVTRMPLPGAESTLPRLPASLQMPQGAVPAAVTMGQGWIAVVTTANHILIFGADGQFRQEIAINSPNP